MKQRIGKFEILREIGHGAMGEVFLARDPVIGREVAIKTLHPPWAATPQARERFFREAQAAGRRPAGLAGGVAGGGGVLFRAEIPGRGVQP